MKQRLLTTTALMLIGSSAVAAPSVSGTTISWPDDGWYQVQDSTTYTQLCAGTDSCTVEPGNYIVINHTTGERFTDVVVSGTSNTNRVSVTGNVISWPDDGWYQVQDQSTYATQCAGVRSCTVAPGTYIVINHTTGERFENVVVSDTGTASPGVTVSGNTLQWPDDGWYQVQDSTTYEQMCAGVRSCTVAPGTYNVINHTSGMRWENVVVGSTDPVDPAPPTNPPGSTLLPVPASIELRADKTFRIQWERDDAADYYRVLENPDGVSGYTAITGELDANTSYFDHRVALHRRVNARYMVEACNAQGCTNSVQQLIEGTLTAAIGYIKASNTGRLDEFGSAVVLSADGNTLVVGAPSERSAATGINGNQNDDSATQSGAAYVFVRNNGPWTQQAYIKASNAEERDRFGEEISLSADGNTLAVSATREKSAATGVDGDQTDNSADNAGAVYVFERSNDTWRQQAYLKASNTEGTYGFGEFFGTSLSMSDDGNTLVVGSSGEDSSATGMNGDQNNNDNIDSGAVYLFERSNDDWQQTLYLKPSNDNGRAFGHETSLSGDGNVLAVSVYDTTPAATARSIMLRGPNWNHYFGAVYLYVRGADQWEEQAFLRASGDWNFFGQHLSISNDGSRLAVAGNEEVYLYEQSAGEWQEKANLVASNEASEYFGSSVSLSGDGSVLVVGAEDEDSAASGLQGYQGAEIANKESGAAYMFEFIDSAWQQQAYIKASNSKPYISFGESVSLSDDGNTLAIGANWEGNDATGINPDADYSDDFPAPGSGAVYLY